MSGGGFAGSRGGFFAPGGSAAAGATFPTTTKGDLVVHDGTTNVRQAVGTNTQVLTADSAQTSGVKWATPAAGTSPTTTKGDLIVRGTSADARLAVGTDAQILVADSTQATGVKWGTPSGGAVDFRTVPSGTFAAPGLAFSAEGGMGLVRVSAGILGFSTGGAEKMRLDNSGNLTCLASLVLGTGAGIYFTGAGSGSVVSNTTGITVSDSAGTARFACTTTGIGFFTTTPIAKPTVTGAKGSNAALASLLTALANYGLVTDSSSA